MNCPYCGTPLTHESTHCPNCGYEANQQPVQLGIPGVDHRKGQATWTEPPQRRGLGIKAVLVLFGVLLIGTLATFCIAIGSYVSPVRQPHPVTFMVNISDYDDESSRIPVRITGTTIDGDQIDQTIYLAHSGEDVELPKGRYRAEVLGSPISSAGIIYRIPATVVSFTLGEDLSAGEPYALPMRAAFEFVAIDPNGMTDEQIQDALRWARKDEASGVDVGKLEAAAKDRLQSATQP